MGRGEIREGEKGKRKRGLSPKLGCPLVSAMTVWNLGRLPHPREGPMAFRNLGGIRPGWLVSGDPITKCSRIL